MTSELSGQLGKSAVVVVDEACCLYEPRPDGAICIRPPYSTVVDVLSENGEWVQIRWLGKMAWALRSYLASKTEPRRKAEPVGVVPPFIKGLFHPNPPELPARFPSVEIGPRGGRYVRTASGFRRYL
jgi:hypothetical protein